MSECDEDGLAKKPFLESDAEVHNAIINTAATSQELKNVVPARDEMSKRNLVELGEDPITTFIKRLVAQIGLIAMCANTISSVFSISASVSLIPNKDYNNLYNFCTYGENNEAEAIYVQCPYIPSPLFQTVLSLWCIYFSFYFSWKYYWTSEYETNDLRFFVYCDKFNSTIVNRVLVVLGLLLTFGSGLSAVSSVVQNGSIASVAPIFVFIGVNTYNLIHMGTCRYKALYDIDMSTSPAFRDPIVINTEPMQTIFNLYGFLINHHALFEYLSNAINASLLTNDVKHAAEVGNVAQLYLVMKTLNPLAP